MADAAPDAGAEERTREMLNTGTKEVAAVSYTHLTLPTKA